MPLVALLVVAPGGCKDKAADAPAPDRFQAVKASEGAVKTAQKAFCEHAYDKTGDNVRAFIAPAERQVPVEVSAAREAKSWRWVNLWATWCTPCIEEFPLLKKWQAALTKDAAPVELELWSIDEDEAKLKDWLAEKTPPGEVHWLAEGALAATFESFGIEPDSAIPVHLLVDPQDQIRCVRVGAVHDSDYGKVRTIVQGG